jgi:phosphohistidine phosphatase
MKTLYLARHAKSSWGLPEVEDLDRPLIEKGLIRTQKTIAFLLKNNVYIDLIISSHAKRALETAKLYANALKYPIKNIDVNTSIYFSGPKDLFYVVSCIPENVESAMIVGHNPTMTQFANCFIDKLIDYMPTSAIVSVEFNTDKWTDIELCDRNTKFIVFPQKL